MQHEAYLLPWPWPHMPCNRICWIGYPWYTGFYVFYYRLVGVWSQQRTVPKLFTSAPQNRTSFAGVGTAPRDIKKSKILDFNYDGYFTWVYHLAKPPLASARNHWHMHLCGLVVSMDTA